jgi:hypothetical protein
MREFWRKKLSPKKMEKKIGDRRAALFLGNIRIS